RVLLIKLADRLHNLRTISHLPPKRQKKVAQESLEVFAPLADRLGMAWVKTEMEKIAFEVLRPKEHAQLSKLLDQRVGQAQTHLAQISRDLGQELDRQNIKHEIDGRVKSIYSLFKKLQKNPIEEIYDL